MLISKENLLMVSFGLSLVSLSSSVSMAQASKKPPETSLAAAIEKTWEASPLIRELNTQVSLAEKDARRRFLPNEPQISYQKDESDQSQSYSLSLNVGFPGKAFAYSKLDSALVRKQKTEHFARKQELAAIVTQAYVECAVAQATIQIREQALGDLETFLHALKSRRGVTQSEKLSLELETRDTKRELLASRDQREVGCKKYSILSDSPTESLQVLTLPEDLDSSILEKMGTLNPEEARSIATIDVAEANYSIAGWSQMPELSLNYGYKYLPATDETSAHRYNVYGIAITLPLLYPFHESVEVRRAKSQALLEKGEAQLQKIQISSDRLEAAKSFVRSRRDLKEIRSKDLQMAQALLESSYSAYRAGQLGYADMALTRKTLTELRVKDVELRSTILTSRLKCLDTCETIVSGKDLAQ